MAFDIANHWCEYAADYHTDTPHLLDYSLMPDEQQQVRQLSASCKLACAMRAHFRKELPASSSFSTCTSFDCCE